MRIASWLTDSLHRLGPDSTAGPRRPMVILAARSERVSCQVGLRAIGRGDRPAEAQVACRADEGLKVRVRRVAYVPVPHHNLPVVRGHVEGHLPGYVGDPLFDDSAAALWPGRTQAFWLTISVSRSCRAGDRRVHVSVAADSGVQRHTLTVRVANVTLGPRRDLPVTHWFYADALCDWYGVRPWSARFWRIVAPYVRNVVAHGQDTLYVPVFTPPLDGVKRPTQLLKVRRAGLGRYRFDFADVRRWVRLAARCGIRHFEFCHLFTQWGAARAIRIYHGQGLDAKPLWPDRTAATGPTYRSFLAQYLPALERFCRAEGIMDHSFFHLSDEPHGQAHRRNYARARAMLADLAPWMKIRDALSEVAFARAGLVDVPIASIRSVGEFNAAGIDCWHYFACGPRGKFLNRLMDTPLSKIRMTGWLLYRLGAKGFLHWGYNYWHRRQTRRMIDPFTVSNALGGPGWAHGDPFEVYPGPDGPIDSVRWEVFAESLQDYALLQHLGVDRDAALLSRLRAYDDFPFSPAWVARARAKLLGM